MKNYASINFDSHNEAQSDITNFKTMTGYPKPITWAKTKNKTSNSITIEWSLPEINDGRSYVHIQLLEQKFNKTEIATRNYCKHRMNGGSKVFSDSEIEGCCAKMLEDEQNRKFEEGIGNMFECSLDNPNYCDLKDNHENVLIERDVTDNQIVFRNLRFAIYIFKIFACNDIGCSNYYLHSDITLFLIEKDAFKTAQLKPCRQDHQYEIELPKTIDSEGIITSFVMSFYDNFNSSVKPIRLCVTEKKHKEVKYHLKTNFENMSRIFEELQIETFSIAGSYHDPEYLLIEECNEIGGISGDSVLISFMILIIVMITLGCYIFRKRIHNYVYLIWLKYRPQRPVDEEILMEEFETIHFSAY